MDNLTPEERIKRMSRIKGKDTKPEMLVRRSLHAMVTGSGYTINPCLAGQT